MAPRVLLDHQDVARSLTRMAYEIWERNRASDSIVCIGIMRGGAHLARELAEHLGALAGRVVPVGALDITLYRDDLSEIAAQPVLKRTDIPFSIKGQRIILCDDVIYTGRTVRAALDSVIDLGRPRSIELAVLVDRGGRELPIQPNYTGKRVVVAPDELIEVRLAGSRDEHHVMVAKEPDDATAQ